MRDLTRTQDAGQSILKRQARSGFRLIRRIVFTLAIPSERKLSKQMTVAGMLLTLHRHDLAGL